ncbi:hypothetical protein [Nisaea sediminum]|uniref:hypothetical protein n=1 Tax=Nisaea sediminum TaxID=2775867 RepID=UPI0018682C0C|nr:hypothetical protein [Nisaea sediminum]
MTRRDGRFFLELPHWRGLMNGAVFCLTMIAVRAWLGPGGALGDFGIRHAFGYGLVFGVLMYLYALWKERSRARTARRNGVSGAGPET